MKIDTRFYKHYEMLDSKKRKLYETLLSKISEGATMFKVFPKATTQDLAEVYQAIYRDQPQLFWIKNTLRSKYGLFSTIVEISTNSLRKNFSENQRLFRLKINDYLEGLDGLSDFEKERKIHDRLAKNITYEYSDLDQTSFSALVKNNAVCAGYSRAFQLLMIEVGIPCFYVVGPTHYLGKSKAGLHAWNIVELDGEFYNLDLTWDDSYDSYAPGIIGHTYYNCTDEQIGVDHDRDELSIRLPACNSTRHSFTNDNNGIKCEIDRVYQVGVTSRDIIETEEDLKKYFRSILSELDEDKEIFLCAKGMRICQDASKIFKEVIAEPEINKPDWRIKSTYSDLYRGVYKFSDVVNGYFRLEMKLHKVKSRKKKTDIKTGESN